jgi:hypothetical protein
MTEKKKVDRVYVDRKDLADFNRLKEKDSPFSNCQSKDIFLAALVVGYHEGGRIPLKNREGYFRTEYLTDEERTLIKAVAIATEGDLNVLLDEQKIYSIAEEYATGGISLLKARVFSDEYGSYVKKLESDLLRTYEKVFQIQPKKTETLESVEAIPIVDLIKNGESNAVEFKASLAWDYKRQQLSKELKVVVARTVSSFMNSNGGILLVGVGDDGTVLGLEKDLKLYNSHDEFERTFTNAVNTYLGKLYGAYVNMKFHKIEDKEIAVVIVKKSPHPVYVTCDGKETFFIRSGNTCQQLELSEANLYIKDHWPSPQ